MTDRIPPGPLAPGIYFDLDAERYHRDAALGSTDIRKLRCSAADYWFTSSMNPHRKEEKDTPARLSGRAMHDLVLEGEAKFDALYMRRPDDEDGATSADKSAVTKAANAAAAKAGKASLHGDVYDRIAITDAMINRDPELSGAFKGGFREVSVVWDKVVEGGQIVRCKCRFDKLKVDGIGDLKGITNTLGIDFIEACRMAFARYRYDIQAAHYLEGRAQMRKLWVDGAVFGEHDASLLKHILRTKAFAFAFVFFQKEDAPIAWGMSLTPGNEILSIASREIDLAIHRYCTFMEKYGPNEMWLMGVPMREADKNDFPAWAFTR